MKPIYKKLLKELEKGNVVLLAVGTYLVFERYRLVTPNNCEYSFIDGLTEEGRYFSKSCFIPAASFLEVPKGIVDEMYKYDQTHNLKITKMQVLK